MYLHLSRRGKGRGRRTERVMGEKKMLCAWAAPEDLEWKTIIQTKQQEMKFSSQGYIQLENRCPCVICQCYSQQHQNRTERNTVVAISTIMRFNVKYQMWVKSILALPVEICCEIHLNKGSCHYQVFFWMIHFSNLMWVAWKMCWSY